MVYEFMMKELHEKRFFFYDDSCTWLAFSLVSYPMHLPMISKSKWSERQRPGQFHALR